MSAWGEPLAVYRRMTLTGTQLIVSRKSAPILSAEWPSDTALNDDIARLAACLGEESTVSSHMRPLVSREAQYQHKDHGATGFSRIRVGRQVGCWKGTGSDERGRKRSRQDAVAVQPTIRVASAGLSSVRSCPLLHLRLEVTVEDRLHLQEPCHKDIHVK